MRVALMIELSMQANGSPVSWSLRISTAEARGIPAAVFRGVGGLDQLDDPLLVAPQHLLDLRAGDHRERRRGACVDGSLAGCRPIANRRCQLRSPPWGCHWKSIPWSRQ
jgi:hypothetical protein